jgi:hypothetical protein
VQITVKFPHFDLICDLTIVRGGLLFVALTLTQFISHKLLIYGHCNGTHLMAQGPLCCKTNNSSASLRDDESANSTAFLPTSLKKRLNLILTFFLFNMSRFI